MQYSGILVVTAPSDVERCHRDLERLPGVEVHHTYPETGRLIVVQEAETVEAQQAGLRAIGNLQRVRTAALVHHYLDPADDVPERSSA